MLAWGLKGLYAYVIRTKISWAGPYIFVFFQIPAIVLFHVLWKLIHFSIDLLSKWPDLIFAIPVYKVLHYN